uniref:Guanine nucleotide-binding protein subunit gamma n=1 Tax=Romanomermis culicivorax TaxID=13658 RepID=A0A915L4G0_ROMCU
MSQVQQMRKQVEQLRREANVRPIPISRASNEIKKYVEDHQTHDMLVTGFVNQNENPYKEKSSCSIF